MSIVKRIDFNDHTGRLVVAFRNCYNKDQLQYLRKFSHNSSIVALKSELEAEVASFFPTGLSFHCIGCIGIFINNNNK
jgi:hypothetical protein